MAKSKEFEAQYKEEGRRRAIERRKARTKQHRSNVRDGGIECDECGGQMSWCDTCQMWTRNCCVEYGTCQCS
jgi:hypothetical protein